MTVHNYRSSQVHQTLNGVHPSSGFKRYAIRKVWTQFVAHGKAHIGQMGKWPWQCTTRGLDNSTKLRMEKIRQAVTKIWVPQVWQPPARPPARTVTTIPLQPGGLTGKNGFQIGIGHWVVVTNHQMPLWKKSILWELIYWKNCSHAAA